MSRTDDLGGALVENQARIASTNAIIREIKSQIADLEMDLETLEGDKASLENERQEIEAMVADLADDRPMTPEERIAAGQLLLIDGLPS